MSLEPGGRLDPDGEWKHDTVLDLGWGRLVFGNTFTDHDDLGRCCAMRPPVGAISAST